MKKHYYIILPTLLLIPFGITLIFHFANYLYQVYDININLKGITHVDWFMFLGSFSGGVCTVLAFILSDNSNSMNLNKTINAGQKQQAYQTRIKAIEEEEKIIASVIAELSLGTGNIYFNIYNSATVIHNNSINTSILDILNLIIEHRKTLTRNNTLLTLKTNILCLPCRQCADFSKCPQNEFANKFLNLYNYSYTNIYMSLGYAHETIVAISKITKKKNHFAFSEKELLKNIELLKAFNENDEYKDIANKIIKDCTSLIEEIKSSIDEKSLDVFFKKMEEYNIINEEIEKVKIPQMLDASRKYIEYCKVVAKEEMEGKVFPKCNRTILFGSNTAALTTKE